MRADKFWFLIAVLSYFLGILQGGVLVGMYLHPQHPPKLEAHTLPVRNDAGKLICPMEFD